MIFLFLSKLPKAIYDDAGASRSSCVPGGPDTYRSLCYERDDTNQTFRRTSISHVIQIADTTLTKTKIENEAVL